MTSAPEHYEVIVVGCGAAGLRAAISSAETGARTAVLGVGGGASSLAAADYTACGDHLGALGFAGGGDPPERLAGDMWQASFFLADRQKVGLYARDAGERLEELLSWGARPFLQLGPRSLLIPSREIMGALWKRARLARVDVLQPWEALGLLHEDRQAVGITARGPDGAVGRISAGSIVIATGGCHQTQRFTTGGNAGFGLGQAWALRAGVPLRDMEAANYCPLVGAFPPLEGSILPYLISHLAPVRLLDAEGKNLLQVLRRMGNGPGSGNEWDKLLITLEMNRAAIRGKAFPGSTFDFHFDGDGAGRASCVAALSASGAIHVEDPGELARLFDGGEAVRVGYAAHYSCGGIATSVDGASDLPGLFACGEAASGTFGAFRECSSMTDCLVSGRAAGLAAAQAASASSSSSLPELPAISPPGWSPMEAVEAIHRSTASLNPIRCRIELERSASRLAGLQERFTGGEGQPAHGYAADLLLLAQATVASALTRTDSRGFHIRIENQSIDLSIGNVEVRLEDGSVIASPQRGEHREGGPNLIAYEDHVPHSLGPPS